jgi:hypothetical protein
MSGYDKLTADQKTAVSQAIALARTSDGQHTVRVGDGSEAYASRHPNGGIGWGVNGGQYGWCLARGIEP